MPSTYSTSLRLELIGNGEQAGNWGNTNNINLGTLLEQAIVGVENVAISGTSYTLTTGNGVSDQARNAVIVLTGTLSANCNVIVPSVDKTYTFRNATTGGFSVVVKTAAGSGVTIANGFTQSVYCDATNVVASGPAFNNTTNSVAVGTGTAAAPSMTFTGDPDTGIYNAGANEIGFSTTGTEAVRITNAGNVGIGTSSPGARLDVAGVVRARGDGSEGGQIELSNPDNASLGVFLDISAADNPRLFSTRNNMTMQIGQLGGTGGRVSIFTEATERMRIDASGNVGVGTSSPGSFGRLAVSTPTTGFGMLGIVNSAGGGGGVQLANYFSSAKVSYIDTTVTNGTPGSEAAFMGFATINNGSLAERLRIDASGNVGIGTSAPARRFEVLAAGTNIPARLGNSVGSMDIGGSDGNTVDIDTRNWPMALKVGSVERMRIDASGNVGVGTSSPGNKLDIVGGGSSQIRVKDGFSATAYYDFGRDGTDGLFGFYGGQTTLSGYKFSVNAGTEVMRINNTGNVGIGTSSPLQRLSAVNTSITGGAPASSGSAADPNAVARFGLGSVVMDVGATATGAVWLQARDAGNYAVNYPLSLNPNGGGVNMVGPVNVTSGALQVGGNPVQIQRDTEKATTSGPSIDFTGIPAGVRRITVMFDAVSFTGADAASIQLGDSGGIETTGYVGQIGIAAGASAGSNLAPTGAAQVIYNGTAAADNCSGVVHIVNQSGNKWLISGNVTRNGTVPQIYVMQAVKTLSDVLDRIRFKVDGASSFDAGSINIMWEF